MATTKLVLSTGNIVAGGPSIIRKPGTFRSNLELTNSLRSNFLAAQQVHYYYAAAAAAADAGLNGNSNGNGNGNGNLHGNSNNLQSSSSPASNDHDAASSSSSSTSNSHSHSHSPPRRAPTSLWTAREGPVLYIPRIDWSAGGLQEEASHYDITVKLFFLPPAPPARRPQYAREALDLVRRELQVASVDLLVVSFPGMSFEGDCEWEADKINAAQGHDDDELQAWQAVEELHRRGYAKSLGIAEFGSDKLARFLRRVAVRPTVDQINIKNCCNVPPPLVKLARQEAIELLVHSDCTDILPTGTLRDLLGHGIQGAGVLHDPHEGATGLQGDLTPEWVVKYTAVVRDRGVIENKGYFAAAELKDE